MPLRTYIGHNCLTISKQQPILLCCADSFHKPGFKLHAKILHHLFTIVNSGVIKAPLWDEAAKGPTAYPNNAVFVHEFVSDLLSRSFPNLRPAQLQVWHTGLPLYPAVSWKLPVQQLLPCLP